MSLHRVRPYTERKLETYKRLPAMIRSTQRKQVEADQAKCRIMPVVIARVVAVVY
jgi:hypothetical protein